MTTSKGAAFFDLDRTLLAGASGEVFSRAMREAGLVSRSIPGENLLYRVFNTVGETLPSMALARQAVTFAKGRSRAVVQRAAEHAADALASMVQPLAAPLFEEHRAAGRPIVLATTTPYDLVAPLARRLGLDDVVATRYGLNDDGTYDGTLDGPFVWSAGKLAAVKEWAERHGVDLAASFAYSDSVYDTPLLAAVGNPFVVNPDPRMVLMAAARRWPTLDLSAAADPSREVSSMAKIPVVNMEIQRLALSFTHPLFFPYAKFDIAGTGNRNIVVFHAQRFHISPFVPVDLAARAQADDVLDAGVGQHLQLFLGGLTAGKDPVFGSAQIEDFRLFDGGAVDLGLDQRGGQGKQGKSGEAGDGGQPFVLVSHMYSLMSGHRAIGNSGTQSARKRQSVHLNCVTGCYRQAWGEAGFQVDSGAACRRPSAASCS